MVTTVPNISPDFNSKADAATCWSVPRMIGKPRMIDNRLSDFSLKSHECMFSLFFAIEQLRRAILPSSNLSVQRLDRICISGGMCVVFLSLVLVRDNSFPSVDGEQREGCPMIPEPSAMSQGKHSPRGVVRSSPAVSPTDRHASKQARLGDGLSPFAGLLIFLKVMSACVRYFSPPRDFSMRNWICPRSAFRAVCKWFFLIGLVPCAKTDSPSVDGEHGGGCPMNLEPPAMSRGKHSPRRRRSSPDVSPTDIQARFG
jgi:hypothetical protein